VDDIPKKSTMRKSLQKLDKYLHADSDELALESSQTEDAYSPTKIDRKLIHIEHDANATQIALEETSSGFDST